MASGKVVVVGSANMDLVVRTTRFPAPGETVMGSDFANFPGGKGANQAVAAGRLGGNIAFVGKVGSDAFGDQLIQSLAASGVGTDMVLRDEGTSGIAIITLDEQAQNTIVVAAGANWRLTPDEARAAVAKLQPDVVLAQLEVSLEAVEAAFDAAPDAIKILNPAPAQALPLSLLDKCDYVTPNETEAEALSGVRPTDKRSCDGVAHLLFEKGVRNVIVTMGSMGCYYHNGESGRMFEPMQVFPIDTTGAGDAFNGALAHFLAVGRPIEESLHLANYTGALSTLRPGAQDAMPTIEELRAVAGMPI
jgi:ribokinase